MSLGKELSAWRSLAPAYPGRRTRPLENTRGALKQRLFRKCDKDGDGFLNKSELRMFVEYVGFEGSDKEWTKEYELLCSDHCLDRARGMTMGAFLSALDDTSEKGLHCSDSEICLLLGIEHTPSKTGADQDEGEGNDEFTHVFFAGANFSTTGPVLKSIFEEIGRVEDFSLFRFQDGKSMGMGRVKYASHEEARRAMTTLHNREVDGRALMLQEDPRVDSDEEPGSDERKSSAEAWPANQNGRDRASGNKGTGNGAGKGKHMGSEGGKVNSDQGWYEGGRPTRAHKGDRDNSDGRTIFFAGASPDSSEAFLRSHFQGVGKVIKFRLFADPPGHSRGMGVAQYLTAGEATKAVERLSGSMMGGHTVLVKIDRKGYLDHARQQSEGYQEWDSGWECGTGFNSYSGWKGGYDGGWKSGWEGGYGGGPIGGKADIYSGWESGQKHGGRKNGGRDKGGKRNGGRGEGGWEDSYHGGEEDSQNCGPASDGNTGKGSGKGGSKEVKYTTQSVNVWCEVKREGWHKSTRVFFSGAPVKMARAAVQQHFAEFGVVKSLTIFKKGKTSRGMGVCCYQGANAAEAAINYGVVIDGKPLHLQQLRRHQRKDGWDQDQDLNPNTSVFFRDAPCETAEKFLEEKFGNVGEIRNFILFTSPDGKSRGMGVVEYSTAESAERAYNEIHETTVSGKTIHVDYFSF
ncbi:unnamed protein product [Prorocentrum cordatum]|uniref:Calmodulin n=1 Tax=Prorocentrum cordatum TaxID=2364126 RepID=A0ABN9PLL0_9DINO|nr:unnamed protein product [Polarella glacialis]